MRLHGNHESVARAGSRETMKVWHVRAPGQLYKCGTCGLQGNSKSVAHAGCRATMKAELCRKAYSLSLNLLSERDMQRTLSDPGALRVV
eukprot:187616-Chlamydomonas_euryale.AAC.3